MSSSIERVPRERSGRTKTTVPSFASLALETCFALETVWVRQPVKHAAARNRIAPLQKVLIYASLLLLFHRGDSAHFLDFVSVFPDDQVGYGVNELEAHQDIIRPVTPICGLTQTSQFPGEYEIRARKARFGLAHIARRT